MGIKDTILANAKKIIQSINPGNTDISNIGDGTLTGAISELNNALSGGVLSYNSDTDYFGMNYNGTWKDILFAGLKAHYLYHLGDECTVNTGGWDAYGYLRGDVLANGGLVISPTITKRSSSIYAIVSNSNTRGGGGVLAPKNATNFNGFNKLKINVNDFTFSGASSYSIVLTNSLLNGYTRDIVLADGITNKGELEFDVAGISGEYYLVIELYATTGSSAIAFDDIYLSND